MFRLPVKPSDPDAHIPSKQLRMAHPDPSAERFGHPGQVLVVRRLIRFREPQQHGVNACINLASEDDVRTTVNHHRKVRVEPAIGQQHELFLLNPGPPVLQHQFGVRAYVRLRRLALTKYSENQRGTVPRIDGHQFDHSPSFRPMSVGQDRRTPRPRESDRLRQAIQVSPAGFPCVTALCPRAEESAGLGLKATLGPIDEAGAYGHVLEQKRDYLIVWGVWASDSRSLAESPSHGGAGRRSRPGGWRQVGELRSSAGDPLRLVPSLQVRPGSVR